ncbi:MAG: type II toxin-antitoxin system RelE/ParE family toxin [Beijerinckiaceae bacterium]|nr:type II toxin-antitoxin system RelE/ParE family toxin [Beijerinckiaceae bacterium]
MAWSVEFQPKAERDLQKLGSDNARRIISFLNQRLAQLDDPRSLGEALQGSKYKNLWKYRVGDFRILAEIEDRTIKIVIVRIGHRREIYRSR